MRATPVSLLLGSVVVVTLGCATPGRSVAPAAEAICDELSVRGRLVRADEPDDPRRFRANLLACEEGPLVFEIRGRVAGVVLSGGVGEGRVRLLFARERTAVEGRDEPAVWERWTGLPLSGVLLRGLLSSPPATGSELGSWTVENRSPTGDGWRARSARGDLLEVEIRERSTRPGPVAWPEIPRSFEVREGGDAAAGEGSPS